MSTVEGYISSSSFLPFRYTFGARYGIGGGNDISLRRLPDRSRRLRWRPKLVAYPADVCETSSVAGQSVPACRLQFQELLRSTCRSSLRQRSRRWLPHGVEQSSIYILPGKTICLADFKEQWNMNADTDEMFDELFNKYGKVVFSRKDKRPPTTEIDDDSESLLFTVEMARVASEVKAADIKVLFVKPLVYWTRFFIIATAFSRPQIDTIGSKMRDLVEKKYGKVPSGDAKPNSWTLLDYVMLLSTYFFLNRGRSITWKNSMETLL
ncbi:hypothetical protein MLD38_021469 [Melastoma candidum]|uniref:Uncharacterized protein n=1 Tax=Melastoma candidum TaxID=119954 RepID=A0ACB9QG17_9MYRT|nr:hypothetical protein MLD38_021469 [Melastoma candidum]